MSTKPPRTQRRSKRIQANHNLLITILDPAGHELAREVVTSVELSKHGARVRGRMPLKPGSAGVLVELRSLQKAPFQVAWQTKTGEKEFLDTGLEFTKDLDFWEEALSKAKKKTAETENEKISSKALLQEVLKTAAPQSQESERFWEGIWSGLVEQLEERKVFTRAELVAYLRKIGQL